jgi:hypothetical protein
MSPKNDPGSIAADPEWLPSHWDEQRGALQFAWLPRDAHARLTFLADEYLRELAPPAETVPIAALAGADLSDSAPHYIFHSAFCCSTLVTRALGEPGLAMGLNEPQILNELADGARRGRLPAELTAIVARLLGRPFAGGENVIVKPSNVANRIAGALMEATPNSRAIFLYAPLERFLKSVAGKGMWGRIWGRRLYRTLLKDCPVDFGIDEGAAFELTDLQVCGLAWLLHQAQCAALLAEFPGRVATLDSRTFLDRREQALLALARHFGLSLDASGARRIAEGPAFQTHSKALGRAFDPEAESPTTAPMPIVDEEIAMVEPWVRAVAGQAGIAAEPPAEAALLL